MPGVKYRISVRLEHKEELRFNRLPFKTRMVERN